MGPILEEDQFVKNAEKLLQVENYCQWKNLNLLRMLKNYCKQKITLVGQFSICRGSVFFLLPPSYIKDFLKSFFCYTLEQFQPSSPHISWFFPGADLSDYFNYGFNEETWKAYCEKQRRLQLGLEPSAPVNTENKITVRSRAAGSGFSTTVFPVLRSARPHLLHWDRWLTYFFCIKFLLLRYPV